MLVPVASAAAVRQNRVSVQVNIKKNHNGDNGDEEDLRPSSQYQLFEAPVALWRRRDGAWRNKKPHHENSDETCR